MDKYLLEILKESNTIIIPGLGALTITNTDTGETMFMPYLRHDDGKLAQFIAEKDGIDEADAKNIVAKYVREIEAELGKGESYSMFQLGTFVKADDGDIEFTHWSNSGTKEEEVSETPVVEEEVVIADEPIVEPEAEVEPEAVEIVEEEPEEVIENTPEPELEATIEEVETPEIPEEVIPEEPIVEDIKEEPIVELEPEPEPEPEPEVIPEPIIEPELPSEPIVDEVSEPKFDEEEIKVKNAIEEALENTPAPETPIVPIVETPEIPKEVIQDVTLEPAPAFETTAEPSPAETVVAAAQVPIEEKKSELESEEIEEKEKTGAKFWIYLILASLLIIGGGAYIGRNYNELKQYVPFLADKKEEVKSKPVMDEMDEIIKEYEAEKRQDSIKEAAMNLPEGDGDEKIDLGGDGMEDPTPVKPEPTPVVKPESRPKPIASSSGGHFHVIAGAFSSVDNANRLAAEFKAKGLSSSVIKNGELNAVSMQSYATSEQANAALPSLREIQPGAWILYK